MTIDEAPRSLSLSVHPSTDSQQIRSDWTPVVTQVIDGVTTHEIRTVVTDDGRLTEMWRSDWGLDPYGVDQVFLRVLHGGAISAWHVHLETTDRLFCASGNVLLVLFDARLNSPTHGVVREVRLGEHRPVVVSIPPGVVHGLKTLGATALVVNAVDRAYRYDGPDHHRMPFDSPDVPYRF